MHPNPIFRQADHSAALDFAQDRGFGILSINGTEHPVTAHVPFILQRDKMCILGHLVAANPIWQKIKETPCSALLSISGPDGYISPDWYATADQVPTWNYVAVNLTGQLKPLPQSDLRKVLDLQSAHFEELLPNKTPWRTEKMPVDLMERMMRQIRPFQMAIEAVDSTWKLSQNKTPAARLAAADELSSSGTGQETARLSQLMRNAE
jgi:transcriptional regulator